MHWLWDFRRARTAGGRPKVFRKMPCEIHTIVEYAPDLDPAIVAASIQQEVARAMNAVGGGLDAVSAVPKMVGPHPWSDLLAALAACSVRIGRNILDGAQKKRLVAQPTLQAEPFMGPGEDRVDIALAARRDQIMEHAITRRSGDVRSSVAAV